MAPEQVTGADLDLRADVFAAGTTLFELLVGRNPFRAGSQHETLARVSGVRVEPRSWAERVPPELARVCARALERQPARRYASAGEMQVALDEHCFERRYGSRQLAEWMTARFPDLGPGLERLKTATQESLAPGQTELESGVELDGQRADQDTTRSLRTASTPALHDAPTLNLGASAARPPEDADETVETSRYDPPAGPDELRDAVETTRYDPPAKTATTGAGASQDQATLDDGREPKRSELQRLRVPLLVVLAGLLVILAAVYLGLVFIR
jgi:hypothetical protein